MKIQKLIIIILYFLSISATAGEVTGKVRYIMVRDDGLHYFAIDGAASGRPGCATIDYWMIRDENSAAGKSQLSMLLAAQSLGKSVYVGGRNTCTRWGDGEDVSYIKISE